MEKKYHISYNFIYAPISFKSVLLVQLGRLYCSPGVVVETHAHLDWYELTVVTGGEGIITTNGIPTAVSEGDIYLSYPGDFHRIESSVNNPLKYDFFSFNTKNSTVKKELRRISGTYSYTQRVFRNPQITTGVSSAIAEFTAKNKYRNEVLALFLEQILYYTIRSFDVRTASDKEFHPTTSEELCFHIMHYIDTHVYSIESLTVLSEVFSYNYSYLSDVFKKTTGNTIINYYRTRRLEAAKLLIQEGHLKIISIAEMLNYSSLYTFSKAFKEKYGVSPKHYLKSEGQQP